MDNTKFDTTKVYISPSKEMMAAFVNGEWNTYLRTDIINELEAKKLSLNPVLVDSSDSIKPHKCKYCDAMVTTKDDEKCYKNPANPNFH